MRFEGTTVPGADWVEIVNVRNKDGSPLHDDNWRRNLFGRITPCWVAGGFRNRGLFFKGKIYMGKGKPAVVDLNSYSCCSTTGEQPVEVEPGVYELVTNTSIYRLRLLTEEELEQVTDLVESALRKELGMRLALMNAMEKLPTGGQGMPS